MNSNNNAQELYLALRIQGGEHNAFRELVKLYDGFIKRLISTADVPNDEKDDLYQEGLIGLYKAAVSYKEGSGASFSTFAGICIRHSVLSALRIYYGNKNKQLRSSLSLDAEDSDIIEAQGSVDAQPDVQLIEKEDYNALIFKIDSLLSPFERRIFKLYLKGTPYGEISATLRVPLKSVDNAVQRIRGKLKQLIK